MVKKHSSINSFAQEINQIIGALEAQFYLHVTAVHLPGRQIILADLGSWAWTRTQELHWTNITHGWTEQVIPAWLRKICNPAFSIFNSDLLLTYLAEDMLRHGNSGANSAPTKDSTSGFLKDDRHTQSLRLVLFATYAWRRHNNGHHLQYATVRSKLSHDARYHHVHREYRPTHTEGHELALIGMQRAAPVPTRQRTAVTIQLLRTLFNQVNQSFAQHCLIYGAAVLGFFFLMRIAEYLEIDDAHHRYVTVLDAHGTPTNKYASASGVRIHFRASKKDQHGHGQTRIMAKATEPPGCSVFASMLLLMHAKQISLQPALQPLCSLTHTRMITAKMMNQSLRSGAESIGLNSASFSTHSLRTGGESAQFGAGVDETMIKMQGRRHSNAYERYTRYSIRIVIALTNQM